MLFPDMVPRSSVSAYKLVSTTALSVLCDEVQMNEWKEVCE